MRIITAIAWMAVFTGGMLLFSACSCDDFEGGWCATDEMEARRAALEK